MNKKYNIAVSGLNAIDSPGPGLAVIRGLKEASAFDCRIIGISYETLEPGIYMKNHVDKVYQIPYPGGGTEVLIQRLEYMNEKENIDLIIPNFDAELYSFIKLEKELQRMGIRTFLPTFEQLEARHKVNLPKFGKTYNIKVPKGKSIYSTTEFTGLTDEFTYPYLVKGQFYDAYIANNIEQATMYFNKISAKWGLPIVIQQFIKGNEYNVTGLGDGKGNTICAVPMRKQYITDKGKAWGGISIEDEEMLELTHHFISQTKWRGGFELELMKTEKGDFYMLEINPRMPAWVYLSVGVGQNIPEALTLLAMGEKVKPYKKYEVGKMFVRYAYDMIVDIADFEKISTTGEL